jgi:tRNA1Val (adenine37-N6)-methyltransferase
MPFTFKQFHIDDSHCGMSVSTDGVLLGAWAPLAAARNILDIGAGSGLLSLMAAQRSHFDAKVTAIELDSAAVDDCQANIANCPWPEKVTLLHTSIQNYCLSSIQQSQTHFDHIICNPPYFTTGPQTQNIARATARHTNQLSFIELLSAIAQLLDERGTASLIIPIQSLTQFKLALAQTPLYISEYVAVSSVEGKVENRLLLALKQDEVSVPIIVSQMFIRNKQGHYSSKMIDLCRDFYLKL